MTHDWKKATGAAELSARRLPLRAAPVIIVGAGMAGLAAAISIAAKGERVVLLEKQAYPGGKMRHVHIDGVAIDAGPTVFTMKWVFDRLFGETGSSLEDHVSLQKANVLARHAWDDTGVFDLFASEAESRDSIGRFFDVRNADGYTRFCADAKATYETLKDTFIADQRPGPIQLSRRIGMTKLGKQLQLQPFSTLWKSLGDYFPDPRLRQLFGRYATYVGSSPFQAPATLKLIAHVEQAGVWTIDGGMHALACAMRERAAALGADVRKAEVASIIVEGGAAKGVVLANGERIDGKAVVYCGDISRMTPDFFTETSRGLPKPVPAKDRALSAITWTMTAPTTGFDLHRHNVFFSHDYRAEFDAIFKHRTVPEAPTIYVCAQSRDDDMQLMDGTRDHMLVLMNAPAFGDTRRLTSEELSKCQDATFSLLRKCGLQVDWSQARMSVTQPADFETL
ncbi:MAG: FAD-dependent oxidoreductase, partial [Pseudomonadota bacterium]